MLKSVELRNFKSFHNKVKIDFEKANYKTLLNTNVSGNLLKGALFVGKNASGKSNVLKAIRFLLECLLAKNEVNWVEYICLFSDTPVMELKYVFEIDKSEIIYDISYQWVDVFLREKLTVDGVELLSREGSTANTILTEVKNYTDIPKQLLFLRDIFFNTRFRGQVKLQKWFEFLSNSVYMDMCLKSATQYKGVDLSLRSYMEESGTKLINDFFEQYHFEQRIEYNKKATGNIVTLESPENQIYFRRNGINEPIPYEMESLGNQTLVQLLPAFFYCISNSGMLLLDEFSSGFHNSLEELLVRYFMKNAGESQFIFVSHSTNLLSNSLLRPDQIYSVDFDKGGSVVKRFSSEKPREAQNIEKMYLGGVFNGIPRYER